MDIADLAPRLTACCRGHTGDGRAEVADIEVLPGHAGLSWGFSLRYDGITERLVLRLPPAGVRWVGTADVLRQARVMQALAGTTVPVPRVRWAGDDLQWFERPYTIVERLAGGTVRITAVGPGEFDLRDRPSLQRLARDAVAALSALHRVDWRQKLPDWGPPPSPADEVTRWDWLLERNADPARSSDPALTAAAPRVREQLMARLPAPRHQGICHGDFQWSNLFVDGKRLVGVLDWELAGIGEMLMDLGWFCVFNDRESWAGAAAPIVPLPEPEEIVGYYEEADGAPVRDGAWYRALAGYKFALITGLNLTLHRRGRRPDPLWEEMAPSAPRLLERAEELLRRDA
jgi:aminoglycoside phosphotransferase (APT) family kinase protein